MTLAGPCLIFPPESRENKGEVGWELPWGRESSPALPSPALSHDCVPPLVTPPPAPCREKEGNSLEVPAALALTRQLLPRHAGAHAATGTRVYLQACVRTQKHRDAFMLLTHAYAYTHVCARMHTCTHAAPSRWDMSALLVLQDCPTPSCAPAAVGKCRQTQLRPKTGAPIAQGH